MAKKNARLRFMQDDSCHWYAIPAALREEFEQWVQSFDDGEGPSAYAGPDFNGYRLGMHISNYSFASLEEDR